MRAHAIALLGLCFAALLGRVIGACAGDDEPATTPDDAAIATDAGATTNDGSDLADAALDAYVVDAAEPCSPDGWCYSVLPSADIADAAAIDPDYVPVELEDVWPMPDHDAWAVANQGYLLHWTNHAWHFVFTANAPLQSVWAASADDVWIAGGGGLVLHGSTKAGALAFDRIDMGTTDDVLRIRGKSATEVLAITANGVYRSTGSAFTALPFPNAIPKVGTQVLGDMWGSGDAIWVGAHEFSTCGQFDDGCNYQDRPLLVHWKGLADAGASASWDRIPLDTMTCSRQTCIIKSGTTSPIGTHFLNVGSTGIIFGGTGPQVAHVTARDAGILDASAALGDGGFIWEMDDPAGAGGDGIWAATDTNAWNVGGAGAVRHWDSKAWELSRVAIHSPLTNDLHATGGVTCSDGTRDVWVVGKNVAMHRTEAP